MSELTPYLLGQLLQTSRSIESDVREVKHKVDDLNTWLKRLALLALTSTAAIGLNINPDRAGEMLAAVLRSLK